MATNTPHEEGMETNPGKVDNKLSLLQRTNSLAIEDETTNKRFCVRCKKTGHGAETCSEDIMPYNPDISTKPSLIHMFAPSPGYVAEIPPSPLESEISKEKQVRLVYRS